MLSSKKLTSVLNSSVPATFLFSKKSSIRLFYILSLILISQSGCLKTVSKPKSNSETQKNVDFRVLPITGTSIEDQKNKVWTFPTQRTYEFRACLVGRATNQQLPEGQKFIIIKPDGTAYEKHTDNVGCLNWQEPVSFNFASDSVYLKKSRRLKSVGSYKGETEVNVAVNPWMNYRNDEGNEVIDLARTSLAAKNLVEETDEELLRRGLLNNDDFSSKVLLDPNLDFDLIPVRDLKDGKLLKMVLRLNPYIEPKNLRGSPDKFELRTGKFKVFAQLVSNYVGEKADQHALLTPEVIPSDIIVTNSGILSLSLDFKLQRQINMGQVQLALKIEPLDTPYPLRAYEGLHNIGTFESILGSNKAPQVLGHMSEKSFSYGEFVKQAINFDKLKTAGMATDLPPVYYDYFDPRFVRIKSGETSTQRTLMYRVTTIVKNSITGDPVKFQPFKIKKLFTNTEEVKSTDENGRLIWNDELSHLYYKPEQYFFPQFEITQMVSGHTFSQAIAVNPWDFGWTFGVDTRGQEEYYKALSLRSVNPPQFMIDAFRYQTIRFRYVIDEFLTLNVKKAVVMALDPLVERNTINEGRKFEPLRNGIYLVKIALVKYYLDPFQNNTRLVKIDANDPSKDNSVSCDGFDTPTPAENLVTKSNDYPEDQVEETGGEQNNLAPGYRLETISCNDEARKGQYTTVIKKLLRVQAGRITTPLEFSMRDLRMMSIRSNIMVQLETIDENKLLRDNIIESKLSSLVEDYYKLKTEDMSVEDKAKFLAEKKKQHFEEAEKLKVSMASGLEQINAERDAINVDYEERDRILSDLESSMGSAELAKNSETYKANINLPEEEFIAKVNKARSALNTLHSRIESYWSGYEQSWREGELKAQATNGLLSIPLEQLSKKPSYYDYLATMQHFLDDFSVGLNVTDEDLHALEINNYSDNPLTPLVDLNLYIEQSGLKRRTFIGPCTLVENDNMSEMRPTDKIDEAATERIDNSQEIYVPLNPPADNREFEQSAYHDSLIPFKDMHVDDIISIHIENEKQYEREMKVMSQMGRYVKAFNLEYVSLTDAPLKDFKPGCDLVNNPDCFVAQIENVTSKNDFLNILNTTDEAQLLGRYFYVRPPNRAKKLNQIISEENTLEPLWSRTKRTFFGFLPSDDDNWLNESMPYRDGGIGNMYHHQAKDYLNSSEIAESHKTKAEDVREWLNIGAHNINLLDAVKICSALTGLIFENLQKEKLISFEKQTFFNNALSKTPDEYLLEYCFSKIHHIDQETVESGLLILNDQVITKNSSKDRVYIDGVSFDRRNKIIQTGTYKHISGKNTNLNVGVGFSVGTYQDTNSVATLGLNGGALLGLPVIGAGAQMALVAAGVAAAPATAAGVAIAGTAAAIGGLVVAMNTSNKADGVNMTTGTSVDMGTYLVIQKAEMDINLEKFEKCLSFQFSPESINELSFKYLQLSKGITSKDLKLRTALSRGYLICDGQVTDLTKDGKKPLQVRENYYYITQHFTAGDMLDAANLLNHVWLLALRGERDFNTFIKTMVGREIGQDGEIIADDRLYDYSLSRLSHVYGKVLPTFPGMYSIQDPLPIHTRQTKARGF